MSDFRNEEEYESYDPSADLADLDRKAQLVKEYLQTHKHFPECL